jgi:hypothetical protein
MGDGAVPYAGEVLESRAAFRINNHSSSFLLMGKPSA